MNVDEIQKMNYINLPKDFYNQNVSENVGNVTSYEFLIKKTNY